jgi:DNA-binding Xre family transcriptional regulator
MSSTNMEDDQENSMTEFWRAFGKRLARFVPARKVNEFELKMGLSGFRLDRVIQGKKGVNVDTLIRICETLDLSPTWLLFGIGPESLQEVDNNLLVVQLLQAEGIEQPGRNRLREKAIVILQEKLREMRRHRDGKILQPTTEPPTETPSKGRKRRKG